jgi:hypothetical protein
MKIKRLAGPMAALAALTMVGTMPVSAQPGPNGWNREAFWRGAPADPYQRIDFLQRRINRGITDGSLDRREARRSQNELANIRREADRLRYRHHGRLRQQDYDYIQNRLDNLSQRLRWLRHNDQYGYGAPGGYGGPARDPDWERRYATNYDAARYYREGPNYTERRLTASDEVYRGSDGRYYCKRNDGTTGLVVGGAAGGLLGNLIDGGHNRIAGTLIGGALGALAGKSIEQNSDVRCR